MNRKIQNHSLQMESLEDRKLMTTVTELGGTAITGDAVAAGSAVEGSDPRVLSSDSGFGDPGMDAEIWTDGPINGIVGEGVDNVDDSTESRAGNTNKLSIGAGKKAILNGSVRADLVNNGMLMVNGDQMDSFFDIFTELSIAEEPQGSNPTPHPLPVPEFLDACFKDQLEHGPGLHETRPDGLDTGPINQLEHGPGLHETRPDGLDTGPINQLEHGPGLHETRPDGLDTGPVTSGPATEVKLNNTPQSLTDQVGAIPLPSPMPVPELSDSVSKRQLEHGPGLHDSVLDSIHSQGSTLIINPDSMRPTANIWTDGTITSLSEFPAKTGLDADGFDHNSSRSNNGIVGDTEIGSIYESKNKTVDAVLRMMNQ